MYIAPIAFKLLFDAPATFQRHLYFKKGIKPVFERIKKCMPIIKIIFQEAGMDYLLPSNSHLFLLWTHRHVFIQSELL